MMKNAAENILALKGLSHKEQIEKFKQVLEQILQLGSSNTDERCTEIKSLIDLLINESVGLVISRQLFSDLCSSLSHLTIEDAKMIANYALEKIQPRAISFEDQVTSYRQLLSNIYENEGEFKRAANMLSGIPLETSQKHYQSDFKLKTYVKIADLFLQEADSVQAEINLSRAAALRRTQKTLTCK
jgi:COP9 signalosome complex subunit 4